MSALVCKTTNNGKDINIKNCKGYDNNEENHKKLKEKFCLKGNNSGPEIEVLVPDSGESTDDIVPVVGNAGNNENTLLLQDADNEQTEVEARRILGGKEFAKRQVEAKERTAARVAAKRERKKEKKREIDELKDSLPSEEAITAVKNPDPADPNAPPPKQGSKTLDGGNRSRRRRGGTKRRRKKKSKRRKSKRRKKARKSKRRKSRKKRSKRRRTRRRR